MPGWRTPGTRIFGLAPAVADAVYTHAKSYGLSLSAPGNRLLDHALRQLAEATTH